MTHSIYTIHFNPYTELFDVRNRVTGRAVMRDLFCRKEAELVQRKLHDRYNAELKRAIEQNTNGLADKILAGLSTNFNMEFLSDPKGKKYEGSSEKNV